MTDETQSHIYQTIDRHSNRVWINLEHVVSIMVMTQRDEPTIIRVAMSNNDMFEFANEATEECRYSSGCYTMRADQFLFALTSYHNQNK